MTLSEVRSAMMDKFATLNGVTVPQDPLPTRLEDKSIIVFPRSQRSEIVSKAVGRGIATRTPGMMQVEYHRRIGYEQVGSVMSDLATVTDSIDELCWKELAGGKFDGSIFNLEGVSLEHLGALGWNEWTFGVRLVVSFTYLTTIEP